MRFNLITDWKQDAIISDGRKSYKDLGEMGYKHSIVIHQNVFVNAKEKHTNSVESIWSQLKCWFRSMHGVVRKNYQGYLSEFEFRYNMCGSGRAKCWKQFIAIIQELSE